MTEKRNAQAGNLGGGEGGGKPFPHSHCSTTNNRTQPELVEFGPVQCMTWEVPHLERALHLWCKRSAYERRDWLTGTPGRQFAEYAAIPTEQGGPIHWAACDALTGLISEMENAGLITADDPLVRECRQRVYESVSRASYIKIGDWPGDD